MKKLLPLFTAVIFLISCSPSPSEKFEEDGVSLVSPKGWAITEKDNIENQGYYLSLEKDGFDSSGLLTLSWINGELGIDPWIDIHKEEMANNIIYKTADLTFDEQQPDSYHDQETTSVKFSMSLLGLKHRGITHFFYTQGKTFSILIQEAEEDMSANKNGFELIEKSFNVE